MRVFIAIEASQPSGTSFRLAFGVSVTPMLAWAVLRFAGLI
jgi:hypothetical protein